MIGRPLKAIMVFCTAVAVVALSMMVTGAAGTIVGSQGTRIPTDFLALFYGLCGTLGAVAAWAISHMDDA